MEVRRVHVVERVVVWPDEQQCLAHSHILQLDVVWVAALQDEGNYQEPERDAHIDGIQLQLDYTNAIL